MTEDYGEMILKLIKLAKEGKITRADYLTAVHNVNLKIESQIQGTQVTQTFGSDDF